MQGADSRPITPESDSQLANSLDIATNTIDDLTLALANFSRVSSPEPPSLLTCCCCGRSDCENTLAWQAKKSRLESRLTLSAQVGQALLQRHEAYVRKHEVGDINLHEMSSVPIHLQSLSDNQPSPNDDDTEGADSRVSELLREKHALEKRLTQALVNNEVTEVSSKTILQELQEARTTISRLSTSHAKSVGWETRLSAAMKEKDDMQQERDFESQRARLAESRFAALKEKTLKLQADVRRLQDELEEKRQHRLEESESILQDARTRIESLNTKIGSPAVADHSEITDILESLVDDNEGLKRDNAELQALLAQSRDDLYALQQEVEEQRANLPTRPSRASTPLGLQFKQHHYSGSMPSNLLKEPQSSQKKGRPASLERRNYFGQRPLTPDTTHLPLSPTESTAASESKFSSYSQPQTRYPTSPYEIEIQVDEQEDEIPAPPEKTRYHKPLFLLTRSRGVQTEGTWPPSGNLSPLPVPTPSLHDVRSESSSFSESTASNMAILIERVVQLLNRMTQSDALTLTNRLKRQHLRGADVGHLSRSTVNNILGEVAGLRNHFRHLLEDEKIVTACTRKDLRALLKLFRDLFIAMGEMRVILNDVILDPSIAPRVSELALDPAKAEAEKQRAQKEGTVAAVGAWIAPITKLFGAPGGRASEGQDRSGTPSATGALTRSTSGRGTVRPPRFVPKLGPALSASATTVNVEFSGAGIGRATTSTSAASPATVQAPSSRPPPALTSKPSMSVMGIFAGAPSQATSPEPWVKIPKRVVSVPMADPMAYRRPSVPSPTAVRANHQHRMSRNVDAVVDLENPSRSSDAGDVDEEDDEEPDQVGPLLERTLRRRGLSDSSIHSTFLQSEEPMMNDSEISPQRSTARPGKGSVLQTLSRKVQSFRMGVGYGAQESRDNQTQTHDSSRGILPTLGNWAAANAAAVNLGGSESLFAVGSPRDESSMFQREPHGLSRHGPEGDFY